VFWHLVNKAPGRFWKDITTVKSVIFPFFHGSVLTVGLSCFFFGRFSAEDQMQSEFFKKKAILAKLPELRAAKAAKESASH